MVVANAAGLLTRPLYDHDSRHRCSQRTAHNTGRARRGPEAHGQDCQEQATGDPHGDG